MRSHLLGALSAALLLSLAAPASAQDDFDDWLDDEDDGWEDELPEGGGEDEFGGDPEEEDEFDFLDEDEEETDTQARAGEDTAEIYRDMIDELEGENSEDQLLGWEEYLERYPNTLFLNQIERRLDELNSELYSGRISSGVGGSGGEVDALQQELDLIQPILLETIDPRTRMRAGFEMGLPDYLNLMLEGEYQIFRELSVEAAIRKRYTGWNGEIGAKYAFVKSARTNMIVTGLFDIHVNSNPMFPALRPQVGVAKLFDVGGGLQVQAQGGVDMELWGGDQGAQLRYVGGANVFYRASETVGAFVETSVNMKPTGAEEIGNFRFNIFTFGLRFFPGEAPANVGLSANVPYATNYWGYHFGAVQGDVNYILD